MGLCVAMIAFVRLPSLKVSCLLLSGLLIYDVFWVSASQRCCSLLTWAEQGPEHHQPGQWERGSLGGTRRGFVLMPAGRGGNQLAPVPGCLV